MTLPELITEVRSRTPDEQVALLKVLHEAVGDEPAPPPSGEVWSPIGQDDAAVALKLLLESHASTRDA